MNGIFLINQARSCMTSQIAEGISFFFRLLYFEYDFMIANLVRLNFAVMKISETSQKHTLSGVLF